MNGTGARSPLPEEIEELTPAELEATVTRPLLVRQLRHVLTQSPFHQGKYGDLGLATAPSIALLEAFPQLPLSQKAEVLAEQEAYPPYGRMAIGGNLDRLARIHMTSGSTGRPVYVALTHQDVADTLAAGRRALHCAGLTPGDTVVHCLNYCMWAGGVTDHLSLEATGATVIPFGVGNTQLLIETIQTVRPTAISCTISYMSRLQRVLDEFFGLQPRDLGLQKAFFGGEGGLQTPIVRQEIEQTWGLQAIDANYGMADVLSLFGAECSARQGLHFHGQGIIHLELIDPETAEPVPTEPGRAGEMVLTNLTREAQPLVRFRTRDLIEVIATDRCQCGRCSLRFRVLGRSDDMVVVRGINVYPSAVKSLLLEHRDWFSGEFELVIDRPPPVDQPLLRVELTGPASVTDGGPLADDVAELCSRRLHFRPRVELIPFGWFPRTERKSRHVRRAYEESA